MATHFSTLAWKIPWTEEPGGLQSMGSQRVRHDRATNTSLSIPQRKGGKRVACRLYANHMQISTLEAFGFRAGESHATLQVRLKAGGKSEVFPCSAVSFSWPSAPTGPGLTQEANPGSLQMKGWQSGTWRGPLCWASLGQNPHSLLLSRRLGLAWGLLAPSALVSYLSKL